MHRQQSRRAFLRRIRNLALAGGAAMLAAGCGGKKTKEEAPPPAPPPPPPEPKPPAKLDVEVTAAGNANGGGLPIVVRVYELKARGGFAGADFFSLYENDAAVLADALLSREEMTLAPGQSKLIHKELSADAAYLGVMGAFRDIDNAQWRAAVPLRVGADNRLKAKVGADAIRIEAG